MESLERKYGLATAIAMVVGVVIGSGVFFKADDVLTLTEGNLILALVAWGIGAFSMIFGALVFAEFAGRIEKANGIVDYFEEAYGKMAGYLVGWFNGVIYFMPLSAILAWVASLYTMILFGSENPSNSVMTWVIAMIYLSLAYVLNYFAPILSGKFQVSTTLIKLIPLSLIAIFGIFSGIFSGVTADNFAFAAKSIGSKGGTFASAVVATAFAYEGWIVAITINNEIKDSKRNLPKALTIGAIIVFAVYILYFLGVAGALKTDVIVENGNGAVSMAAQQLFGTVASTILTAFVVISCLGTLNGLVLSSIRIPYSLALRNNGPFAKQIKQLNTKTTMPFNSAIFAFVLTCGYMLIWYFSINETFGAYIGLDEIPIVMIYGLYVFLYVWYMVHFKDLNVLNRFVKPICAILGSAIILYGGIMNPSIGFYLIVSIVVIGIGLLFYRKETI